MMRLQHFEGLKLAEEGKGCDSVMNPLHQEEVAIIDGALTYREMKVSKVMTPVKDTFVISAEERLSYQVCVNVKELRLQLTTTIITTTTTTTTSVMFFCKLN